jgi:YqaJ-like recombinase protein
MIEIIDCEQRSEEWFAARAGIPTASEFSTVMAEGKGGNASVTRGKYLRQLAGEILTGEAAPEGYSNLHMERGREMEAEARSLYAFLTDSEPQQVGFIRNGRKGGSPDSLIGANGGLEIKTAIPAIQIDRLQRGILPPEHKAQVQGTLWVTEREWWDFVSYWPKLPPLIVRVYRDEPYIDQLAKAIDAFNTELDSIVASIRTYQNFAAQAAA